MEKDFPHTDDASKSTVPHPPRSHHQQNFEALLARPATPRPEPNAVAGFSPRQGDGFGTLSRDALNRPAKSPAKIDWTEAPPVERMRMSNPIPSAYLSCHTWRFNPVTGDVVTWETMLEMLDLSRVTMLIFLDLDQCPDFKNFRGSFDPGVVIIGCHGSNFPSRKMLSDTGKFKGTVPGPIEQLMKDRRLLLIAAGKGDQAADSAINALARVFSDAHGDKSVVAAFVSNDAGYLDQMRTMDHVPTALYSPDYSVDAILDDLKDYWIEEYGTEPVSDKNAGTPADPVAEHQQPSTGGRSREVQPDTTTLLTPVSTASEDAAEEGKAQPQVGNKRGREGEGNEDGEKAVGGKRLKDT